MVISDYWKLKESKKLSYDEKNDICRCDEDKLVYAVFPKKDKIYPMYFNMDMLHMNLTLACISPSFMCELQKIYGIDYLSTNKFERKIHFDEYRNLCVEGVDKIKIFSNYEGALDFVKVKTDIDFVKTDDKGNYLFSKDQAKELIAKFLQIKPSRIKLEN